MLSRRGAGSWRGLGVLTAVFLAGASVSAAKAEDWWLVATGVDGERLSSDVSSLACQNGKCSIWEMTVYGPSGREGVAFVKDLADYDCAASLTRTRKELSFDASGAQIRSLSDDQSAWRPAPPATVGASLMAFACRQAALQTARAVKPVGGEASAPPPTAAPVLAAAAPHAGIKKPAENKRAENAVDARLPAAGGGLVVQVGAAPTAVGGHEVLARLARKDPAVLKGMTTGVEAARSKGTTVYRATVGGFGSSAAARAFCQRVQAGGGDCFVRARGAH